VLILLSLIGLSGLATSSRADTPIYGANVLGEYIGSQTSSYSGLNPFLIFNITSQSSYWDTGGGTHNPWSYISGTISIGFGPNMSFSGTVRWGGRMDITYWYWNGSWQSGSYTGWIMYDGYNYEVTGETGPPSKGTYTTDAWVYLPFFGWLSYEIDAGTFYVFRL
jgi:hypothetical protein